MAYDDTKPANDGYLAAFPPEMREQLRAMIQDAIVNSGLLNGLESGNASGNIPVSNGVENTNLNAAMVSGKAASAFALGVHSHDAATTSSDGFETSVQFNKLATVATNAEVNQMAFSNVLIGGNTIQSESKTGTVELVPGTNITLAPDNVNKRVTVGVTGKVGSAAVADSAATCSGNALTASSTPGNAATATNATNHIANATGAHAASAISGLATVATTGAYGNLSGVPTSLPANGGTSAACSGTANYANTAGSAPANGGTSAACSGNAASASSVPWSGVSGAPAIPPNADAGHSFATNGWQKLSSGLIIQWGSGNPNNSTYIYTFPIAFPNYCFSITLGNGSATISSTTKTGFTVDLISSHYWMAIGY